MPCCVTNDGSDEPLIYSNGNAIRDNNIRKKISYGKCDIAISVIFGVIFYLIDVIGDVIGVNTISQYYNATDFKTSAQNNENKICIAPIATQQDIISRDGSIINPYFWFSISVLVLSSVYISCKSGHTYWKDKEERKKLTFKSFQECQSWCVILRWLSHILLVAPVARTIDLICLRINCCQSFTSENNLQGMTTCESAGKKLFDEQVKEREQELTNILHHENSFKSGPQLCLKLHLLYLYLNAGNKLGSYGYLNLCFIMVGIASCAWKTVCNRKTNNLSNDNEKKFSLRKHIIPLWIGHCLSVGVRLILLSMLSATSFSGLRTFCETHFGIVFFVIAIYKTEDGTSFYNPSPNRGSVWNKIADSFNVFDILFSTLFSFMDFDEQKDRPLRIIVYYVIPFLENFFLLLFFSPTMPLVLRLIIGAAMVTSVIFFRVCENFQGLRTPSLPSPSTSINETSLDGDGRGDDNSDNPSNTQQPSGDHSSIPMDNQGNANGRHGNSTTSRSTTTVRPNDGRGRPPETAVGIAWWQRIWTMKDLLDKFQRRRKDKEESSDSKEADNQDAKEDIKYSRFFEFESSASEDDGSDIPPLESDDDYEPSSDSSEQPPFPETAVRRRLMGSSKPKMMGDDSDSPAGKAPKMKKKKRNDDDEDTDQEDRRSNMGVLETPLIKLRKRTQKDEMTELLPHYPPALKEWKDMNELLSDGDLGDEERNAIRRKDLNWICSNMRRHLFQVLTLMLAENGTDLNASDKYGMSPITRLCWKHDKNDLPKILELLINNGAKVKAVEAGESTTLSLVCEHYSHDNMKDVVDLLIKGGVPVNTKNRDGETALHKLVSCYKHDNMKDIVDLLIKAGVPVDAKDNNGDTALHPLVELYKHDNMKDVVDLLIKSGVPVHAKNHNGNTALHLLAEHYKHDNIKDVVDLLIKSGVLVDTKNLSGDTALHLLIKYYTQDNMKDVVDLLIKSGVPVDAKNDDGETALHLLAKNYKHENMKDVVDVLIKNGVPVDTKDTWGNTALHLLVKNYGHGNLEEIVVLLKDNGARLDVQNDDGLTPLMELCGNENSLKHIRVFSLLTPDARDDPLLSDTQSVTRLLKEFGEEKISPENLADGLKQIHMDVMKKCWEENEENNL